MIKTAIYLLIAFVCLTRIDGKEVWVNVDKVTKIHESVTFPGRTEVLLDSGVIIGVTQEPKQVVDMIKSVEEKKDAKVPEDKHNETLMGQ